jgi:hypothetical protein
MIDTLIGIIALVGFILFLLSLARLLLWVWQRYEARCIWYEDVMDFQQDVIEYNRENDLGAPLLYHVDKPRWFERRNPRKPQVTNRRGMKP